MANVHHATRKAADKDLSEGRITEQSHAAVLAGQMDLHTARNIGVDAGSADTAQAPEVQDDATEGQERPAEDAPQDAPAGPRLTSRISKDDRSRPCLACGEMTTGSLFHQGCDMKMFRVAREHLTEGRELTDEQCEYLETSGKMERVRVRLAEEERKRQERERRKVERQGRK